jgi:hypothetical protein
MTATTATAADTVAYLTRDGGWGAWVRVTVASTPEADAAAAAFFRRASTLATGHAAHVDEEGSAGIGPAMLDVFFPTCEHGLSAHLCADPINHYPADL